METIKLKRTGKSKFGFYLMDENEKFSGCSEQVSNFLKMKVPCEIEVQERGEKGIVNRVRVIESTQTQNNSNEFEQPVEVVKPGFSKAENYKPSVTPDFVSAKERQKSIESQMCIYAAIQMIEAHNKISETKIEPTQSNLLTNAKIVSNVLKEMKKDSDLPDY